MSLQAVDPQPCLLNDLSWGCQRWLLWHLLLKRTNQLDQLSNLTLQGGNVAAVMGCRFFYGLGVGGDFAASQTTDLFVDGGIDIGHKKLSFWEGL
jgi:hypothetical protein